MEEQTNVEQPKIDAILEENCENYSENTPTNSEMKINDKVDEIAAINALENGAETSNVDLEAENKPLNDNLGSTGKFKSTEELLKAYKNLEAEFTRKSQKLKELEREKNASCEGKSIAENLEQTESETTPIYLNENWESSVGEFLVSHPNAKNFASEICELIINDKQVASSTSPLETAWQIVASKNFVDKNSIISDDDFINNYVLNNKEVLDKVVSKYIKQNLGSAAPVLISGENASEFSVTKKYKPLSFEDAKAEAEKLF